jgi:hypothetical protein
MNTKPWQAVVLLSTGAVLAAAAAGASEARAEELEGTVRVVGSSMNTEVILTPADQFNGPAVCYDDLGKKVSHFTGMTVKVVGDDWKTRKSGEKKCLIGKSFVITKAPSGRPPLIGTLGQKDGTFVVTAEDGKEHRLDDVPAGMKKFDGQKVILDAKPMEAPSGKEAVFKVVTYGPYPQ